MTKPTTKEELVNRISIEWNKITQKECLRYIDSMPSRIEAAIKSNGGPKSF
jgi:nucleoid DNA-binding protein